MTSLNLINSLIIIRLRKAAGSDGYVYNQT